RNESVITTRPPFGALACATITDSSSDVSRTEAAIASTPKDEAAALKGFRKTSAYGAVAGLNRKATRLTGGAISLSSSSDLPAIVGSILVKPVTMASMRRDDPVVALKGGANADRDRLLADIAMHDAVDLPGEVVRRGALLKAPDHQHLAQHLALLVRWQIGR